MDDNRAPRQVDLLIKNGAVVTMNPGRDLLYGGALAVDAGRIVAVGPTAELAPRFAARRTIDARGKAVLPGLIDTHHHCLQNLLKGSRDDLPFTTWIEQVSSPLIALAVRDYKDGDCELQRQATRLACAEALLSGITCLVNMEWATAPELAGVYEEAGIRAVHVLTLTDVDQWASPGMLLGIDATLELAERWIARCRVSAGGRVQFRYGPACENSVSAGLFRDVRRLATQHGVGIHLHLAESEFGWYNVGAAHGTTPVRYVYDQGLLGPDVLAAHCIWLANDDLTLLAETGTSVSYNPECHMKLALGTSPVARLLQAGVTVSLGTDTCAVNDDMDLFAAMRTGAFQQKMATMDPAVLPANTVLEMATLGGARALGLAADIGSLEPGKKADLIVVDLGRIHLRPINHLVNNLVYCASAAHDVETVVVDGRVVVDERRLVPWDAEAVVTEAEGYAQRRFRQAGLPISPFYSSLLDIST